jgi:hypothetical protein
MKTHQLKHRIELISDQLRDIQLSLQRRLDATDARFDTLRAVREAGRALGCAPRPGRRPAA